MKKKLSFYIVFLSAFISALCVNSAGAGEKPQGTEEGLNQFFEYYENNNYAGAFSAVPQQIIDSSCYEKGAEQLPLFKRDADIYLDIAEKKSGEKALPAQRPQDKEILYYLGVMNYRLGNLEDAKQKLLQCLQLYPTYRMAHVYLFRVFTRLQDQALAKAGSDTKEIAALLFEKVGYGNPDLHYELATKLLNAGEDGVIQVLWVTFLFDNGSIKDLKTEETRAYGIKQRGTLFDETTLPGLYRVELTGKDRHCLDEEYFPSEQKFNYDGLNAGGQLSGGQKIFTSFPVTLAMPASPGAHRIIIYNPSGKKIYEYLLK